MMMSKLFCVGLMFAGVVNMGDASGAAQEMRLKVQYRSNWLKLQELCQDPALMDTFVRFDHRSLKDIRRLQEMNTRIIDCIRPYETARARYNCKELYAQLAECVRNERMDLISKQLEADTNFKTFQELLNYAAASVVRVDPEKYTQDHCEGLMIVLNKWIELVQKEKRRRLSQSGQGMGASLTPTFTSTENHRSTETVTKKSLMQDFKSSMFNTSQWSALFVRAKNNEIKFSEQDAKQIFGGMAKQKHDFRKECKKNGLWTGGYAH